MDMDGMCAAWDNVAFAARLVMSGPSPAALGMAARLRASHRAASKRSGVDPLQPRLPSHGLHGFGGANSSRGGVRSAGESSAAASSGVTESVPIVGRLGGQIVRGLPNFEGHEEHLVTVPSTFQKC